MSCLTPRLHWLRHNFEGLKRRPYRIMYRGGCRATTPFRKGGSNSIGGRDGCAETRERAVRRSLVLLPASAVDQRQEAAVGENPGDCARNRLA